MKQKGFTLIELLVVVAIIGILAAVGVVAFQGFINNARENAFESQHKTIVNYVQAEFAKCMLGAERIMGTTSRDESKCSVLASGSSSGSPDDDAGTALKDLFDNIFEPLDGAGRRKLAFAKAAGDETKCTARDSGGDAGCHFLGWDRARKVMLIYSYIENNVPIMATVPFPD